MIARSMFVLIFFLIGFLNVTADLVQDRVFQEWKLKFQKNYKGLDEESKAYHTFLANQLLVDQINSANGNWKAELNQFADLTSNEFKSKVLMAHPIPAEKLVDLRAKKSLKTPSMNIPQAFDWRTDGNRTVVTSVKDQGTVGTCWAFSTVGNIEGQWALAGHELVDLSPEYLVDCDGTTDGSHGDCSVFGGWPYLAYQFVIKTKGIPSESSWPYCSGTGECYPCMQGSVSVCGPPPYYCDRTIEQKCPTENHQIAATITDYTTISTDENVIAEELVQRGPLSVLLDATQLQFYKSGVWDGYPPGMSPKLGCRDGAKASLDHAVLMVGYGVESSSNTDYWIVKNSWGTKWGESGYFRITRGQERCGINTGVTSSIV